MVVFFSGLDRVGPKDGTLTSGQQTDMGPFWAASGYSTGGVGPSGVVVLSSSKKVH